MTRVEVQYRGGAKEQLSLTYDQWIKLFKSGEWEGKKIADLLVIDKHSDKGPNRVIFPS